MSNHYEKSKGLHLNYSMILDIVESDSTVLDLGCGNGDLLKMLKKKNIESLGVEINQDKVINCIEKGLSVIQGDIDKGLGEFNDKSYDYVVLNQTLQSTNKPEYVINEMLRVGKKVVVSFPNFAYWRVRFYLFFKGKMPKSNILPFSWHNTPNIHLLTINDFYEFTEKRNIKIIDKIYMNKAKTKGGLLFKLFPNFYCEEAMFVIER